MEMVRDPRQLEIPAEVMRKLRREVLAESRKLHDGEKVPRYHHRSSVAPKDADCPLCGDAGLLPPPAPFREMSPFRRPRGYTENQSIAKTPIGIDDHFELMHTMDWVQWWGLWHRAMQKDGDWGRCTIDAPSSPVHDDPRYAPTLTDQDQAALAFRWPILKRAPKDAAERLHEYVTLKGRKLLAPDFPNLVHLLSGKGFSRQYFEPEFGPGRRVNISYEVIEIPYRDAKPGDIDYGIAAGKFRTQGFVDLNPCRDKPVPRGECKDCDHRFYRKSKRAGLLSPRYTGSFRPKRSWTAFEEFRTEKHEWVTFHAPKPEHASIIGDHNDGRVPESWAEDLSALCSAHWRAAGVGLAFTPQGPGTKHDGEDIFGIAHFTWITDWDAERSIPRRKPGKAIPLFSPSDKGIIERGRRP